VSKGDFGSLGQAEGNLYGWVLFQFLRVQITNGTQITLHASAATHSSKQKINSFID
jgi:hypothetical protein